MIRLINRNQMVTAILLSAYVVGRRPPVMPRSRRSIKTAARFITSPWHGGTGPGMPVAGFAACQIVPAFWRPIPMPGHRTPPSITWCGNRAFTRWAYWCATPGDRERAARILDEVIKMQYRNPGWSWDGTFRRTPIEPEPVEEAVRWIDYDPNWREFIGTAFAVVLNEFPDRIPAHWPRARRARFSSEWRQSRRVCYVDEI